MNSRSPHNNGNGEKCFAFVIPVRHPEDKKVTDYRTIEILLERTVRSLLKQTHRNIVVIVVCHRIPDWAEELDDRVTFLDISNEAVFAPDQNHVTIDKGLKYVLGVIYAMSSSNPQLIMLLDADDYVHVELADRLLSIRTKEEDSDGYIVRKGVHVGLDIDDRYRTHYRFGVVVDEFDFTCGSCRIFDAGRLYRRIIEIHPAIGDKSSTVFRHDRPRSLRVPEDLTTWLDHVTEGAREEPAHVVNLLGRHTQQKGYLNFREVDFVAAAKGCGHGNHDGPRHGAVHWYRVVRRMPLGTLLRSFGLPPQLWPFSYLSMMRTRAADKRAGNAWRDG